jgi:phage N-6-adenine-methyltransferase
VSEPTQKPGRSRQDYGTPPELLTAVKARLGIKYFDCDLAASAENTVAADFFTEETNALDPALPWQQGDGWNWLNPPFAKIAPWVEKAYREGVDTHTAVLIPAAVGSNWWRDWVHGKCRVMFLNPRITFVGCDDPYPKDCALLLYSFRIISGYDVWTWKPATPLNAEAPAIETATSVGAYSSSVRPSEVR